MRGLPPLPPGHQAVVDILEDITAGKGQPGDIDLLLELAEGVKLSSLCGFGQMPPIRSSAIATSATSTGPYKTEAMPPRLYNEFDSSACHHSCPIHTGPPYTSG